MAAVAPGGQQVEPDSDGMQDVVVRQTWSDVLHELQDVVKNKSFKEASSAERPELQDLSLHPADIRCPSCDLQVTTEVQHKVGGSSVLLCYLLGLLGCFCGCCLLPFCMNYFKDVRHLCPSCHKEICTVHRL